MTKITKQENKALSTQVVDLTADVFDTSDIIIPRLMLMQAMSPQVSDGKAAPGDILESSDSQVVAKLGSRIELIPIMGFKEWYHYEEVPGQAAPEYLGKEPWTQQNKGFLKKETRDGKTILHLPVIDFFMLATNKLEDLPFLVAFKKSSYNSGKKLSTHFQMAPDKKYIPWSSVFTLSGHKTSYEKYTYFIYEVEKTRECKQEEFEAAQRCREKLAQSKLAVAEDKEEAQTTSSRLATAVNPHPRAAGPIVEEEIPL